MEIRVFSEDLIARLADVGDGVDHEALPEMVTEASERIAAIYAGLLARGVQDEVVARAMLGATISLYDGIGLATILPRVLRLAADNVEKELAGRSGPAAH